MSDTVSAILHIDDDPTLTRLVDHRLREFGFQVDALHDPTQAIDQLCRGKYQIALLDVDMPNMNGIQLLQRIKQFDGGIQVIMLTGVVSVTTVLETMQLGAEACFFKPLNDIQPLVTAIQDAQRKIHRWWNSLNDLKSRRTTETTATIPAVAAN